MNADSEYKAAYEIYSQAVSEGANEGVVASAKADADAKQSARDSAKNDYDYAKNNTRSDLANQLYYTESDIENLTSSIEAYEASMEGSSMSYEDCVADVQAKQRALDDLMGSLFRRLRKLIILPDRSQTSTLKQRKKR